MDIIRELVKKRDELLHQAEKIGHAIAVLGHKTTSKPARKKRRIPAAARKKMSMVAKARWAKRKGGKLG